MATPPPPLPDASPATVRTWFATLLHTLHSVPEPGAREIASNWQFGRGSELRYYDVGTFRDIFGVEAGTLLFGHARGELRSGVEGPSAGTGAVRVATTAREKPKVDIFRLAPSLGLVYLMLALAVLLGTSAYFEQESGKAAAMAVFTFVSMFGFLSSYFLFYFV